MLTGAYIAGLGQFEHARVPDTQQIMRDAAVTTEVLSMVVNQKMLVEITNVHNVVESWVVDLSETPDYVTDVRQPFEATRVASWRFRSTQTVKEFLAAVLGLSLG